MLKRFFGKSVENEVREIVNMVIEAVKKGENNNALSLLNRAIKLDPNQTFLFNSRGNVYRNLGNYNLALSDFQLALKMVSSQEYDFLYEIYCGLGCTYNRMGNWKEAISYFTRAIEIKPNDMLAFINRGIAYQSIKDFENAISDYSEVINLSPKWHGAYLNRAYLYSILSKYSEAINDYEEAIKLVPAAFNVEPIKMELNKLRSLT
jgi:tetratricopeptide (TPR) repeat protein